MVRTSKWPHIANSAASLKVAQTLARQSDINLTMNTYTQIEMSDQSEAVKALPALPDVAQKLVLPLVVPLVPQLVLTSEACTNFRSLY